MKKVLLVGIVMTAFTAGCFDPPPEEIPEIPAPTSPANVLSNVAASFNRPSLSLIEDSLGPSFIFHFDPEDVGQNTPTGNFIIPESWSRNEFLRAVGNMYVRAYSLDMAIGAKGVGTPREGEETYLAEYVTMSLLVMVDELSGFIAEGGYQNFEFEKYNNEKGEVRWRLTGWWDHSHADFDDSVGSAPSSFGRVLALYY
ncbi:MAG: hypothetical protein PVH29_02450 [Candidatus Zixiibacteriota bacterium]|jgi:hypothetical protein